MHDLGCGIGADAMAFAGLDLGVQAVDADAVTAVVAAVNLRHWPDAVVTHAPGRGRRPPHGRGAAAYRPLARPGPARAGSRRHHRAARGGCSRSTACRRRGPRCCGMPRPCRRRGPSSRPGSPTRPSPTAPRRSGSRGTATSWSAPSGGVRWSRPRGARRWCCDPTPRPSPSARPTPRARVRPWSAGTRSGRLLYEPDRAVIRAGLTGALAREVDGAELSAGVGYVGSDRAVDVPWAHRYAVREALPWNVKAVRGWLRDRGSGG